MLKTTLFTYLYIWFYILGFTELHFYAFLISLPQSTCHCTLFCFVSPGFIQISQQMHQMKFAFFLQNSTKYDLQGYLSKLTPTPLRVTSAARDSHMSLAEWTQMPKIKSFSRCLFICLHIYCYVLIRVRSIQYG